MRTTRRRIFEVRLVDYDRADKALEDHLQLVNILLPTALAKVGPVADVVIDHYV